MYGCGEWIIVLYAVWWVDYGEWIRTNMTLYCPVQNCGECIAVRTHTPEYDPIQNCGEWIRTSISSYYPTQNCGEWIRTDMTPQYSIEICGGHPPQPMHYQQSRLRIGG